MEKFLEMNHVTKQFDGVTANDDVSFSVRQGEVHALLGENGAGKTTLMNILYGLYTPTSGEIIYKDKARHIASPKNAIELGIGMIHQHFMLIPALTVVENIVLEIKMHRGGFLDLKTAARQISALGEKYGFSIDPFAYVWQLSVGEQQRVEIVKALYRGADLLILDEPTAVLTPAETRELFAVIRQLTAENHSVIFISHKLNEVIAISDRVSVLRNGKNIGIVETKNTDQTELARMMVGRDVNFSVVKEDTEHDQTVLSVRDLVVANKRKMKAVKGLSFEVKAGEIFGIAGVDGNGQSELIAAISGLVKPSAGSVTVNGANITGASAKALLENGVSHIPEDRQRFGVVMDMSLCENAILQCYNNRDSRKKGLLDWAKIRKDTQELIDKYDVKCKDVNEAICKLSGGNQQKFVLGRELERNPCMLLAIHPTRGLDVGAIEFVHRQIIDQRNNGCAVLLVSTELEEIMSLSDRIAVMYEGKFMGILDGKSADIEKIGLMMAGVSAEQAEKQEKDELAV
jgi:simple sugar transport system ATP-binding protein